MVESYHPSQQKIDFMNVEFMRVALFEAREAIERDSVPIGVVIVHDNRVIASVSIHINITIIYV